MEKRVYALIAIILAAVFALGYTIAQIITSIHFGP